MYALASLGAPPLLCGRRATMCTAKGSGCTPWRPLGLRRFCVAGVGQCAVPRGLDVRPGVPWGSASFAWQAWDNVYCQGVGCTPWRPLGLRRFCVAGVGQSALPRGLDVRPGVPWGSASFAWQAWDKVHCQGVGMVRPGVPWGSASFAWQAWDNLHCQGVWMYALASLGAPPLLRGRRGTICTAKGMYALASLGAPPLLRGRRGTMCTAKGSDVRPGVPWGSASFVWQACDNVHCQGVWMYALASLGAPPLLRGRRGTMCSAKGSGCTPWRPLGLRLFCVAGVGQCVLPRGWMYALASLGAPPLLRGRPGVGCTPWRPLGLRRFCVAGVGQSALPRGWVYALASLGAPPLLRGRRGTICTAKGLDVRPGVPWGSAAFAWQAWDNLHLPRGWMYALASLGAPPLLRGRRGTMCIAKGSDVRPGVPWGSASFAWQAWDNVHCQGV